MGGWLAACSTLGTEVGQSRRRRNVDTPRMCGHCTVTSVEERPSVAHSRASKYVNVAEAMLTQNTLRCEISCPVLCCPPLSCPVIIRTNSYHETSFDRWRAGHPDMDDSPQSPKRNDSPRACLLTQPTVLHSTKSATKERYSFSGIKPSDAHVDEYPVSPQKTTMWEQTGPQWRECKSVLQLDDSAWPSVVFVWSLCVLSSNSHVRCLVSFQRALHFLSFVTSLSVRNSCRASALRAEVWCVTQQKSSWHFQEGFFCQWSNPVFMSDVQTEEARTDAGCTGIYHTCAAVQSPDLQKPCEQPRGSDVFTVETTAAWHCTV